MKRTTIIEIISFFFVTLFLYTGLAKVLDYEAAKEQLALTPLLAPVSGAVVIGLPLLEIITAVLLFLPRTRKIGLYASEALMVSFIGYIIYILNYNDQLPCTCGGVLEALTWPQHLAFNGACMLLLLWAILLTRRLPKAVREKRNQQKIIHQPGIQS